MLNFSALFSRTLFLVLLLPLLGTHASPAPNPDPSPVPGLLPKIPILDALLALGASPPPPILRTTHPSPECASINQGELLCCRATVAGDIQLVVWLAELYGYNLNPNDINGLNCDTNLDACPGTKLCCQVSGLSPLLALWCHDYP